MPYPRKYESNLTLRDGTQLLIRPIRPDDIELEREFIMGLSDESSFYRFFSVRHEPTLEMVRELCNVDYEKQMAFVAEAKVRGRNVFIGVARIMESTEKRAEMAIVVSDDYQGKGLAAKLMTVLLEFAGDRGFASVYALILPENAPMINLAKKFGFQVKHSEDKLVIAELTMRSQAGSPVPESRLKKSRMKKSGPY
jgi:acetyltransferase